MPNLPPRRPRPLTAAPMRHHPGWGQYCSGVMEPVGDDPGSPEHADDRTDRQGRGKREAGLAPSAVANHQDDAHHRPDDEGDDEPCIDLGEPDPTEADPDHPGEADVPEPQPPGIDPPEHEEASERDDTTQGSVAR